jgi:two-component system, OmpR family, response regulator MtrA
LEDIMEDAPGKIPTILVAEDDPAISGFIQLSLQGDPWIIRRVENGKACLDSVRREKPDLILMDVMMPLMDGYTAANALAQNPDTKDIPIMILTAKRAMRDAFLSSPNIVGFMEKPFSPSELAARVRGILQVGH